MPKLTFEIKIRPVTVNDWKRPVMRGRKLSMVLTNEYRAFLSNCESYIKHENKTMFDRAKWLTEGNKKQPYGLRIRFKKHGNSDFSNYSKAIEDAFSHCKATPDDKYALFAPVIIGEKAPKTGFIVEVFFGEELIRFYDTIKG